VIQPIAVSLHDLPFVKRTAEPLICLPALIFLPLVAAEFDEVRESVCRKANDGVGAGAGCTTEIGGLGGGAC